MEDSSGLSHYIQITIRRKLHFLVAFLTVVSLSFVFTFLLPKIYQSQTTLMIEKKGRNLVKGIFKPGKVNITKFQTMKEVFKSQAKIEEIIKKLSLDKAVKGPLEYENLVKKIKNGLQIEMRGSNLFDITYKGRKPKDCMQIVNTVANFFVEQDLNERYGDEFASFPTLNKLLDYYEKRVNKARGALTKFKIENKGQMPGSLDNNFSKLEEHQIKLTSVEVAIKEALAKQEEIEKRLIGEIHEPLPGIEQEELSPEEIQLKQLNQKLETMLTTYTEKHPAILKLKKQIEIQKKKLLESYKLEQLNQSTEDAVNLQSPLLNPHYLRLRKLLQQTKEEVAALKGQEEEIKQKIISYDEKVKNAPIKEQEYAALQRELNANQSIYKSLLTKLEKTRLTKEMNLMDQNISFTVITPAQLPLAPISPKMSKNLVVGTILGLFLGICSAFWAEYTDHSLRNPEDIKSLVQVPILATIPTVYTEAENLKRRRMMILAFIAGGVYVTFLLLLIAREFVSTYTPSLLYLQTYKNLLERFLDAVGLSTPVLIFIGDNNNE